MTTLDRLLGALSRVYDTTPDAILGLRLSYSSGRMSWTIADDVLTTVVPDGIGTSLSIDLTQYTLSTLSVYLASQPGYEVLFLDDTGYSSLSALALVPGSNDIATSNGDHLYVARNPTWTYLAALAIELGLAETAIEQMPTEMATTSANGIWLDVLGGYYAVPRQLGEQDSQYSPRIPAEVILPRQNNTAIAAALGASTGQLARVDDAPVFGKPQPAFDGQINFSGAPHLYNASASLILNLFDVAIGYALLGSLSPTEYLIAIRQQIDRLRAAGTHLRNLTMTASVMGDRFTPPTDAFAETLSVSGMSGFGQSSDSATATGIFPEGLMGISATSVDAGTAALSTTVMLAGTGASVDAVAFPNLAGTGTSQDGAQGPAFSPGFSLGFASLGFGSGAPLTIGIGANLVGSGGSINASFGAIGSEVIFNGTSSSISSAAATLRIGAGLSGTGASADDATAVTSNINPFSADFDATFGGGTTSIDTGIVLVGTGASLDSGALDPGPFSNVSNGFSSDSATGIATTGIKLVTNVLSTDASAGLLSSQIRLVTATSGTDSATADLTAIGGSSFLAAGALGLSPGSSGEASLGTPTGLTLLQQMAGIGCKWVRVDVYWDSVQPSNSTTFNWYTDQMVANIVAAGMRPLLVIARSPAWANGTGSGGWLPPTSATTYGTFCGQVAARYSASPYNAHWFEIWNEQNLIGFWTPGANTTVYGTMLTAAVTAIHTADAASIVVSGGLSPAATGGGSIDPVDYITALYANGSAQHADAIGWHPYCYPVRASNVQPWSTWSKMQDVTPNLRAAMIANGDTAKKVWMTEFGAPTAANGQAVTEAEQAAMVTDAVNLARTYSWAGPWFWYNFQDDTTSGGSFGLVRSDGSHKPSYAAFDAL